MPTTKRDYYEILGVDKGASVDAIKRAYRSLAMKYHPDRVDDAHKKEAEEKFKEISEAYAVLSDAKKRQVYDQYGHAGFDQRYSTEDIFRSADFSSIFRDLGLGGSIFEDLFGGFDIFGGGRARGRGRGADLQYEVTLSFEEAAQGVTKQATLKRREICTHCKGSGGSRVACVACAGTGQLQQSAGFMIFARPCSRCQGEGSRLKEACSSCRGEGKVLRERRLEIKIPAGVESGMRLRLSGEGEAGARSRGDLYVLLRVKSHPVFEREGSNLIIEYPVGIAQVALGAEVKIPTLNGHVSMKIPAGTQSGTVFRMRGKGLPDIHGGRKGDLLVRTIVETPTNLTGAQRQLLQEFERTFGDEAHPSRRSFVSKLKDMWRK